MKMCFVGSSNFWIFLFANFFLLTIGGGAQRRVPPSVRLQGRKHSGGSAYASYSKGLNAMGPNANKPDDIDFFPLEDDVIVDANDVEDAYLQALALQPDAVLNTIATTNNYKPKPSSSSSSSLGKIMAATPDWSSLDHEKYRPEEYRLVKHLLRYYDSRVTPLPRTTKLINVTFGVALAQIIDVDEKNQLITTSCWLNTAWVDFQLTWDPKQWNGITQLRLPYKAIWLPDVLLYNNADVLTSFSSASTNVIVSYYGNVTWLTMTIYKSTCSIDVKNFPFDEQTCSLYFASWTYDGHHIAIETDGADGDVSNYMENTEWLLINFTRKSDIKYFSCCPDEPYPFITYSLQIRRRPLYYVYNLFMPCILITLVALLGFAVPCNCGEKVSMGITTLLSMTVFLMVVAESMPPTKSHVPLLGLYFGFTIVVVSCTTGLTVVTLNIHYQGKQGKRLPKVLRVVLFRIMAKLVLYCVDYPNEELFLLDPNGNLPKSLKDNIDNPNGAMRKNHSILAVTKCFCRPAQESLLGDESTACNNGDHGVTDSGSSSQARSDSMAGSFVSTSCFVDGCDHRRFDAMTKNVKKLSQISEGHVLARVTRQAIESEWEQAASIIDRFMLIVLLILTLAVSGWVLSNHPMNYIIDV